MRLFVSCMSSGVSGHTIRLATIWRERPFQSQTEPSLGGDELMIYTGPQMNPYVLKIQLKSKKEYY